LFFFFFCFPGSQKRQFFAEKHVVPILPSIVLQIEKVLKKCNKIKKQNTPKKKVLKKIMQVASISPTSTFLG